MKRKIISIVLSLVFVLTTFAPCVLAAENTTVIYVSPNGNDSALGGIDTPLKTLDGARQRVRELKAQGIKAIEVIFRGGDYYTRNVKFTAEDSGTPENPIVYKAYEGETPRFKGSVPLDVNAFKPVTDEKVLSRVKDSVRYKLAEIDLTSQGVSQGDIFTATGINTSYALNGSNIGDYNSVYVDGTEGMLAQWPNGRDFATWSGTLNSYTIIYTDPEPDRWVNAKDWWVFLYNGYDYAITRQTPSAMDTVAKTISINPSVSITNPFSKRWKAFNLLEELDMPGEYYIDRDAMKLYMYVPYTLTGSKVELSVEGYSILNISNLSDVTFQGLSFEQTRGNAVRTIDINNVDFVGCTFKNIADKAIRQGATDRAITGASYWQSAYGLKNGAYNSDVKNCYFENIGSTAIYATGGDVDTLTPSNNIYEDNIICAANQRYVIDSAMVSTGCGNVFRRNVVTKSVQHGIHLFGNNHVVEDNEFADVLREVADAGVIYMGRNQLHRGNVIQRNLIHNVQPKDSKLVSGTCGIYMDDGHQDNIIINNFIIGVNGNGYNSNQGAAMDFSNNIIVDNKKAWAFHQNKDSEIWDITMMGTLDDMINDIYDKELYFKTYPKLKKWYETKSQPRIYSTIHSNLLVNCESTVIGDMEQKYASIENNVILDATDAFADPANIDYRLKADSALAKELPDSLNTENYDIEQNGTINDRVFTSDNTPFRLLYPQNGAAVSPLGLQLYWQDVGPANQYRLEIARDPGFTDVVYDDIVYFNIFDADMLSPNTRYYWRVTAQNTTRDLACEWAHSGNVHSFVTSMYTPLDTASVSNAIAAAKLSMATAVEGETPGTYKMGSVDGIKKYIDLTSKLVSLRTGMYSQSALDVRTSYINSYFKNKGIINRGYINLFDYAQSEFWHSNMTAVTPELISLDTAGKTGGTKGLSHISGSVIYCFDVEMQILNGGYSGIGINLDNSSQLYVASNRGYFMCVKNDLVELQKTSGSANEIVQVKDIAIADGKRHSVQWGIINTSVGNIVIAIIDGETVFEYMDVTDTAPTHLGLEFSLSVYNYEGSYTKLYPSESIPSQDEFNAFAKAAELKAAKAVMASFPEDFSDTVNIKNGADVILTDKGIIDVSYAKPELVSDNMMVPANVLSKVIGVDVAIDGGTATISKDGKSAVFAEGKSAYTVNGASNVARYTPYMKNGYLMVSILDIMEVFEYQQTEDWLNSMAIVSKSGALNAVNDSIFISKVVGIIDNISKFTDGKDIYFADVK